MEFFGVIAFDGGDQGRMDSRSTNAAPLMVIADWVNSVVEYHQGELNYNPDCEWWEITISVYVDEPESYGPLAAPIHSVTLRKPYLAV